MAKMNLNQRVVQFTPPVLLPYLRRVGRLIRRSPPEWEYLPRGWPLAAGAEVGWAHESVSATQRARWSEFIRKISGVGPLGVAHEAAEASSEDISAHNSVITFGYVLGRAAAGRDVLRILDWGGGIGHYAALARVLLPHTKLDYTIVDLAALCEAGREINPDVTFHDDLATVSAKFDLVMASGSLQFSPEWMDTFRRLASLTDNCFFVTRLPTASRVRSFVVLQRAGAYGYRTSYPGWVLSRHDLLELSSECGLVQEREFIVGEKPYIAGAPEQPEYRGFLFTTA
jgi:putative methyltransferase (TIGR04325 family)